jgi:DNA repair protein RadA/Sms
MTLYDLLQLDIPTPPLYESGIKFLDEAFDGGFEMGQLVTVTGEPDAGKTMITEQILANVSQGHKCLYFALEFNKRQAQNKFKQRVKNGTAKEEALKNVEFISAEDTEGEVGQVLNLIQKNVENGAKFVVLDSTIMLYIEGLGGEQEVTKMFYLLQNLAKRQDILLFVITQSSKDENKEGKVGIFGSQKASHFANIMLHLTYDKDEDERGLIVAKNKQNGRYLKQKIFFSKSLLTFNTIDIEIEDAPQPQQRTFGGVDDDF